MKLVSKLSNDGLRSFLVLFGSISYSLCIPLQSDILHRALPGGDYNQDNSVILGTHFGVRTK